MKNWVFFIAPLGDILILYPIGDVFAFLPYKVSPRLSVHVWYHKVSYSGDFVSNSLINLEKSTFCAFLSSLAYSTRDLIEETAKCLDMEVDFFGNENHAFVLYNDKEVYLSFRGANSVKDFFIDGQAFKVHRSYGRVHNGFADTFERLYPLISKFKHFESTYGQAVLYGEDRSKTIYVCGHSQGGAVAILCARWFASNTKWDIKVYTYGQPRVGDWRWRRNYNRLKLEHYRFVHAQDIVTKVPRLGYWHVGTPIYINDKSEFVKRNPQGWRRFFLIPLLKGIEDHKIFKSYFEILSGKLGGPFLEGRVDRISSILKEN